MNNNQLILKIKGLLDQLATTNSNIQQEPYKSDLYEIFLDAASQGFPFDSAANNMHADNLIDELIQAGVTASDPNLSKLHSMWTEWSYCYKKGAPTGGDGKVVAHFVSTNDDGKLAFVSSGYALTARISMSGLKVLNNGPIALVAPQHSFPKNGPIQNVSWVNGALFGG